MAGLVQAEKKLCHCHCSGKGVHDGCQEEYSVAQSMLLWVKDPAAQWGW